MTRRRVLDWDRAHGRLARAQEAADQHGAASREQRERIFQLRAELLAAPPPVLESPGDQTRIMTFHLGAAHYGVPLEDVVEVISDAPCAKVPGAPLEVAGVIQVRGEIRPVYDLSRILGIPEQPAEPMTTVLLLRRNGGEFGAFIGAVEDIRAVGQSDRLPAPEGARHVLWLTQDLVTILNTASFSEGTRQ